MRKCTSWKNQPADASIPFATCASVIERNADSNCESHGPLTSMTYLILLNDISVKTCQNQFQNQLVCSDCSDCISRNATFVVQSPLDRKESLLRRNFTWRSLVFLNTDLSVQGLCLVSLGWDVQMEKSHIIRYHNSDNKLFLKMTRNPLRGSSLVARLPETQERI